MSIELVRDVLLWCTILNYVLLLLSFAVFAIASDWIRRFHGHWFKLSTEQFHTVFYLFLGVYKLGIFLFNLVPLVALYIAA